MTKSTNICGMKPRTAPTPATTPSSTRAVTNSDAPAAASQPSITDGIDGTKLP